jgi:hypothetical protein
MGYKEIDQEPLDIAAGDSVRLHFRDIGEIRKFHVMQVIDGYYDGQKFIFGRFYGKHKQYWIHRLIEEFDFKHMRHLAKTSNSKD